LMTDKTLVVTDDLVVSLDYTLRLEDKTIVDTSAGREPLEFLQGHGQIIPGLEQALYGMAVGEEKEVKVLPDDGYGQRDAHAFQQIPSDALPPDLKLEQGMTLELVDNTGQPIPATVAEVHPNGVLLDLNHPLAGEILYFQAKIAGLRAATSEEIAHGHVHGSGGAH
jgi:FKBP-type peptidyl-prolyl cis-trans isomerase SlyD